MLFLQDITYAHPNKDVLFADINLTINKQEKIALIGNNGTGKSTLLKLLAGQLAPNIGKVKVESTPYYVPQLFGQFNDHSIAQALQVDCKLTALKSILSGDVTEINLAILDDDWAIEERCQEALAQWNLGELDLVQKMGTLSGGQKAKVFLAGIHIHQPEIVLMDEPSNHLDTPGRKVLYEYIKSSIQTLVVVSHDRTLLNILNMVLELSHRGIFLYGGNYDFYIEQKKIASDALNQDLKNQEKALRKAKETERESIERKQKLDARGKKKQAKAGISRISMNTLKNNAEKSSSRIKEVHTEKVESISLALRELRNEQSGVDKIKMDFEDSAVHKGKVLITGKEINVAYDNLPLWQNGLNFQILSGERIVIRGLNGSGKTTLIRLILGKIQPQTGDIERTERKVIYIDQDYSLLDDSLNIYDQVQQFNSGRLQENEIKTRLNRFLFTKEYWDKQCKTLSGGEKMRLMLCCLAIGNQSPDLIVLDEPTNNLDLLAIEILTAAIKAYKGTLLIVSHDEYFLKQVGIERSIVLEKTASV